MRVCIPKETDIIYNNDRDKVYLFGGRWNPVEFCYEFQQGDIEALIEVQKGQWYGIKD